MTVSDAALPKLVGLFILLYLSFAPRSYSSPEISSIDCPLSDERACDVCICSVIKLSINCSGRNLIAVPGDIPHEYVDIDLSRNQISCVPLNFFESFSSLRYLKIDRNKLERPFVLPASLINFNGDYNLLQSVDEFFIHCNNLHYVTLFSNQISRLRGGVMKNCSKLENLHLQNNNIGQLENTSLDSLYQLKELRLALNHNLNKLEEGALSSPCRNLQMLGLQGFERLHEIPMHLFDGCDQLSDITMEGSGLNSFHPRTLFSLKRLFILDLSFTNISFIAEETFQRVTRIDRLKLSTMNLHEIPPKIFYNTSITTYLDLSGNFLRVLPEDLFSSVHTKHSLATLVLSSNLLETLPIGLVRDLHWLAELFLDGNRLLELPAGILNGTVVRSLYIFGNQISNLTQNLFTETTQNSTLSFVQAQGNPLLNLADEFLLGTSQQSKLILSCDNLLMRSSLDREIVCVLRTSTISINVTSGTLSKSLGQRGFNCKQDKSVYSKAQCTSCKTGTYGNTVSGTCAFCPRGGFYQDEVGQYQSVTNTLGCKFCNNGTFVIKGGGNDSLSCKVCPDGTDKRKRAGFRACFCLEGYFRRDRFGKCEICPQEGLNCSGDYVRIMPGYFWDWSYTNIDKYIKFVHNLQTFNNSYKANDSFLDSSLPLVHKCHEISRCVNNDSIAGNCKDGYQGWMCSGCSEGLYEVFGSCHQCPEIWIFLTEIVILFLVLASFCVYVVCTHRREQPERSRTIIDVTLARSKIVLGFYQVMGEFWQSLGEFHWPERFKNLAAWLNILQFNISTILIKPSCYFPKIVFTPYVMFVIGVSVPLAILVCLTFVFFIGKAILRYATHGYPVRGHTKVIIDLVCDKALTIGVLALFITYPSTCNAIFALYSPACDTFYLDELKTINISILRSDYSINCTTSTHSKYVTASYVASTYVVAFPFILFCLLWKYKQKSPATSGRAERQPTPKWLRFLNENYKNRFWFWEILELLRKISQTFILILFGWSNAFTITVTLAISVVFLSLHTSYSPMKDRFEHYLQLSSLWAIFLNMLVATVPSSHVSHSLTETAMGVLLIFLNLLVIGIIVGKPICFLLKIIHQSRIFKISVGFMVRLYWKCRSSLFGRHMLLIDDTEGVLQQPFIQNAEHYGSIN